MKKNKKSAGIIYTVKNKITGEYYVGATTDSLHQRRLDHQERADRNEQNKFHEAIATYGKEAFEWKQTDTASSANELAEKEKEYIKNLDSKVNGFNSSSGGEFKKDVYQYDKKDGSHINTYESLDHAAKAVNARKTSISNACLGQNKTCMGFYWSYNYCIPYKPDIDFRKKVVMQLSPSGQKIAVYESVASASRLTGISKTCISRVCRGERIKSGGFYWKYI